MLRWRCGSIAIAAIAAVIVCMAVAGPASAFTFSTGDVFAGVGDGTIKIFSPTGSLLDTLLVPGSFSEDTGMAFDQSGNLYATLFEDSKIVKFDINGNLVMNPFATVVGHPESVVVDNAGHIYVGVTDSGTNIVKYDTSGTVLATYTGLPHDRGFDWIDLQSDQHTMRYTGEGTDIRLADVTSPPGTAGGFFATGLGGTAYAHRILPDGGELLANSGNILRLDSTGAIVHTYPLPPGEGSFAFALNVDPDGTSFWTAGFTSGNVYNIDIASGTILHQFNAGIVGPSLAGLAVFGEQTVGCPTCGQNVPEPPSFVLLGTALVGLWGMRRYRGKGGV